ncbi:chaperonin family protein RbcX [Oscillatoriales cyanobacterium LEGE 11467]|uniref:RuBisCO chaperone RbcX n=1 Tax=Zarconia navalis LEGE 11467 TaxID=1828826 RepID=A0A928VXR2_9CYAN|nr:chaperonin family protein RbcX [Zarconia navalis]MBE9041549.1 chaperonin family protein RbcX [Zarconia navalis LEGE 11467]
MDTKQVAKETAKVLQSYLTYQAVQMVIKQLSETNPPLGIWLRQFSSNNRIQDGEAYLRDLMGEKKDLVLRILTVREHLAEEMLDFMPEMVRTGIQQANIEHRRQMLERMTQTQDPSSIDPNDVTHPESDINDSPD